jgi:hypothetical protein
MPFVFPELKFLSTIFFFRFVHSKPQNQDTKQIVSLLVLFLSTLLALAAFLLGLFGSGSLGLLFQFTVTEHRLDNLLFFNQERANDALTHALAAKVATVSTGDGAFALREVAVFLGAKRRNAVEWDLAAFVTTFGVVGLLGQVVSHKTATRGFDRCGTVAFGSPWVAAGVGDALDHCSRIHK